MANDLVLTPGGFRPRSAVHLVEPGHSISAAEGMLRILRPGGEVAAEIGQLPRRPAGVPLHPNNVFIPEGLAPALGGGWISYASWTNTTGHPIKSFQTTWLVPPPPLTQSGQTIFLFNGIQNSTMIYQPVLQWGSSAAGGGNYWSIASWYVDGQNGPAFHSQLIPVNPGARLVGVMTLTGQQGSLFSYNCVFQGIANSGYPIQNVEELTYCIQTLEAYSVQKCSDYPAAQRTEMAAIEIQTTAGQAPVNWTATNSVQDCNQHTVVVSNASPNGEVGDLLPRRRQQEELHRGRRLGRQPARHRWPRRRRSNVSQGLEWQRLVAFGDRLGSPWRQVRQHSRGRRLGGQPARHLRPRRRQSDVP